MTLCHFLSLASVDPVAVESSAIAELAYEHHQEILYVQFRDGSIYQYSTVSLEAYRDLLKAASKGAHFNQSIRNHFPQRIVRRPVAH